MGQIKKGDIVERLTSTGELTVHDVIGDKLVCIDKTNDHPVIYSVAEVEPVADEQYRVLRDLVFELNDQVRSVGLAGGTTPYLLNLSRRLHRVWVRDTNNIASQVKLTITSSVDDGAIAAAVADSMKLRITAKDVIHAKPILLPPFRLFEEVNMGFSTTVEGFDKDTLLEVLTQQGIPYVIGIERDRPKRAGLEQVSPVCPEPEAGVACSEPEGLTDWQLVELVIRVAEEQSALLNWKPDYNNGQGAYEVDSKLAWWTTGRNMRKQQAWAMAKRVVDICRQSEVEDAIENCLEDLRQAAEADGSD